MSIKRQERLLTTLYFFAASLGIEIPAFRHNFGTGAGRRGCPGPQSIVLLPSLYSLPWGSCGLAEEGVADSRTQMQGLFLTVEQVCGQYIQRSLYLAGASTALQDLLQHEVFATSYGNHKRCFWFLKNWAQNWKQKWSWSLRDMFGKKREKGFHLKCKAWYRAQPNVCQHAGVSLPLVLHSWSWDTASSSTMDAAPFST